MTFQINQKKKSEIQELIIKHKKSLRIIRTIALIFLWSGVAGAALYLVLSFTTDLNTVNVNGVFKKDILSIIFNPLRFITLGFVIWLMLCALLGNLSGVSSGNRADEELSLINGVFRYTFRIKHQTASSFRAIVIIPLADIEEAKYDPKTHAIHLHGRISSDTTDDYFANGKEITPDAGNWNEFVLYDYFEPGLLETLRNQGISI